MYLFFISSYLPIKYTSVLPEVLGSALFFCPTFGPVFLFLITTGFVTNFFNLGIASGLGAITWGSSTSSVRLKTVRNFYCFFFFIMKYWSGLKNFYFGSKIENYTCTCC